MKQKQKIVVIGIIQDGDKILVSQRLDPNIPDAHLKWDVPGGTNEFGESLKDTLKREIFEETGLNVEVEELLPDCASKNWQHADYFQHTLVFCYLCSFVDGRLHSEDHKIDDHRWLSPEEALQLDLLLTTRRFIEMLPG